MGITSQRTIGITFSGDEVYSISDSRLSVSSTTSPGMNELIALTTGDNTISVPVAGTVARGMTIIPPAANTVEMILKGDGADTGVTIHKTDPTSVGLDTTVTEVVVTCDAPVNVRFIWT